MGEKREERVTEELLREFREQFDRKLDELRLRVDELREAGKKVVVERPLLALGVAFALGLALGVALTRSRE